MELEGTQRLREEIECTLRRAFDPADVLPRLARLARLAPASSEDALFAHRQLAELIAPRHPWRAALHARRALAHRGDDDRSWAVLAFCHTLLGNFRCAVVAYERALASSPTNPWYAHNLGHLLDLALGEPTRAVPFLRAAHEAKPESSEMAASFAHALARDGRADEARRVLEAGLVRHRSRELAALLRWLDQGAPSRASLATTRRQPETCSEPEPQRRAARAGSRELARVLSRGLGRLPLDARQRARAMAIAREVSIAEVPPPFVGEDAGAGPRPRSEARESRRAELASIAAAVAYAIVYVDHVPLTQGEVAAPFRVGVARVRGRFAELRAKLGLVPGDVRYATSRR